MNLKEALAKIKENWAKYTHEIKEDHECVWITVSDTGAAYETDEEWIGMKGDGSLVWAYASGCSCWSGEYEVHIAHNEKEIKAFSFNHDQIKEGWEKAIIKFAEDGELVKL